MPEVWHHEDRCNGRSICRMCGKKDPDHLTEEKPTNVQTVVEITQYMQEFVKDERNRKKPLQ